MKATARKIRPIFAILSAALLMASCQTGKGDKEAEPAETQPVEFKPARVVSQMYFDKGDYPTLFASSSYAVWVNEAVSMYRHQAALEKGEEIPAEYRAEARQIADNFVVIECHLDSVFADSSIGLDVVGLRGVSLYLSTPDGKKIPPIQTVIGTELREEPRDALRLFGRTNYVIFPRRDLWLNQPTVEAGMPSVRLVIEAYDSHFYFEWPGAGPTAAKWQPGEHELVKILETGFRTCHSQIRELAGMFY